MLLVDVACQRIGRPLHMYAPGRNPGNKGELPDCELVFPHRQSEAVSKPAPFERTRSFVSSFVIWCP